MKAHSKVQLSVAKEDKWFTTVVRMYFLCTDKPIKLKKVMNFKKIPISSSRLCYIIKVDIFTMKREDTEFVRFCKIFTFIDSVTECQLMYPILSLKE